MTSSATVGQEKRSARSRAATAIRARRSGSSASVAQSLTERGGIGGRHEQAVVAVADHVAVADDVRCHDGRVRGKRLRQHHAEALAAERRRAQQVGLTQQAPLLRVADAAGHVHALGVHQHRLDLFPGGAGHRQPGGHAGTAQGLEGAQQHGQALAGVGAAHEQQLQRSLPRLACSGRAAARSTPFGTIR